MNVLLNSRNPSYFEYKFKRKPKQWDIDSLIVLYRKAKKRKDIILKNVLEYQDKILKLGYDMVFYHINGNDMCIEFEI